MFSISRLEEVTIQIQTNYHYWESHCLVVVLIQVDIWYATIIQLFNLSNIRYRVTRTEPTEDHMLENSQLSMKMGCTFLIYEKKGNDLLYM